MVSYLEILEALRVYGRLSSRNLRLLLQRGIGADERCVMKKILRILKANGYVRIVGKDGRSYVWELTPTALGVLKRFGANSFYEIPRLVEKVKARHPLKKFE